jgi:hypothetical protein
VLKYTDPVNIVDPRHVNVFAPYTVTEYELIDDIVKFSGIVASLYKYLVEPFPSEVKIYPLGGVDVVIDEDFKIEFA